VRVICLSATISNVDELCAWLQEIRPQDIELVRSTKRPVPLSHWCHTTHSGTFESSRVDKIAKIESHLSVKDKSRAKKGKKGGQGSGRGHHSKGRWSPRRNDADKAPDGSALFDEFEKNDQFPALVFSFSRKDVERLARRNERRDLLNADEKRRMIALQHELMELFKLPAGTLDGDLFAMARCGVSYHHAGMLPVHKEVVERMFCEGLLKLLFTTETFALGINMPARSVVFQALRKFDGISFDWLRTRDYQQMAGRAGRQGIDDKGYVYCLLGERDLREAPIRRLVDGKPEPVVSRFRLSYSTLLQLVSELGRERVPEAWEKSFNQFQSREKSRKAREKHARIQDGIINRHLDFLEELGYLNGDELTARGRVARVLYGYELQVTELLYRGVLENLPPRALAVVFVGLIHEERRRFDRPYVPGKMFGDLRYNATTLVNELSSVETRYGIEPGMKKPDWGLTPATLAWFDGCPFEELEERTDATPGDVCRVFRMAVQLMRNVRYAIDPDWDLTAGLREAVGVMNREEIDARRQLQLG